MNLFATGGTGFFGKALLRFWQNNNPQFKKIYLLSRSPETFLENNSDLVKGLPIEFIEGNILNLSDVTVDKVFDVILHAATDSTIGPSLDRLDVYQQITHGTEETLKFAINHNCKKFLLTTSGAVYGAQPSHLDKIPEDYLGIPDPLDPNSAYGIGKRAAEHLTTLYSYKYGFDYVIARCFAFIGEDLPFDAHFAIGNFIRDSVKNKAIVIKGDGSSKRSYMYQNDLAEWLMKLLKDGKHGQAYNVGSDESYSISEVANIVNDIMNNKHDIVLQNELGNELRNIYIPDISKSKMELNLQLNYSLREAVCETIQRKLDKETK